MMATAVSTLLRHRLDGAIAFALALLGAAGSLVGSAWIDPLLYDQSTMDSWFQSDFPRVLENMVRRGSDHYRAQVHPLFAMVALPPTAFLWKLGLTPQAAAGIVIAGVAAAWVAALYALLRLMRFPRLDSALFTVLGMTSAAAMFWFTVPETYSFGSLSILIALLVAGVASHRRLSETSYVAASVLSLSFTITNWMAGIAASLVNLPFRRAVQVTVNALAVAALLWAILRYFIPSTPFFLQLGSEMDYVGHADSGGPLRIVPAFLLHSIVMPAIDVVSRTDLLTSDYPQLSVQHALPGSAGILGVVSVMLWTVVLAMGIWGIFSARENGRFRLALGLVLSGQLLLHLAYGEETFLYALHYVPLLVVLAAYGTTTRARYTVLGILSVLIVTAFLNNWGQFAGTSKLLRAHQSPRAEVRNEMLSRPADPWPRGEGHVVLAVPGSVEEQKAYHEPGGSFSPGVESFGVSIWVQKRDGRLLTSGDAIPMSEIKQSFDWKTAPVMRGVPAIETDTRYFRARWTLLGNGIWRLHLERKSEARLALAIRSVGPAGGPIERLRWDGRRLLINERWEVTPQPGLQSIYLGEERTPGWVESNATASEWRDESGWSYARIDLGELAQLAITIKDKSHSAQSVLPVQASGPELNLPDPRFENAMRAQVSHLLMSLVGAETRAADPTSTPISWQRDAAYIVVALAAAGQIEVAKELTGFLAENDFYGGFGAEADSPGFAIWALRQVAVRVGRREFERNLWPHVERKASYILEMLDTTTPIYRDSPTPLVPRIRQRRDTTLVAAPAVDGLIVGRMDFQYPLLFVNAVSYRGLIDAAWFADRLGRASEAQRWRKRAALLRSAWNRTLAQSFSEVRNDRSWIIPLWPTAVADLTKHRSAIRQGLEVRWRGKNYLHDMAGKGHRPKWTYFEIGEAHQWLYLGVPDKVWDFLNWFLANHASPGLYSWWEDTSDANSFHRWNNVRGWINPPHTTPHYWTSAEMLLLQLDMLAYLDDSELQPVLVIGGGVPTQWLGKRLQVRRLSTAIGEVDWSYENGVLNVVLARNAADVRVVPGTAFPPGTQLRVTRRHEIPANAKLL